MHISRTDLNLFVVFEAIYSRGGVTRAAEVLNLTQPTISHSLRRLRERIGDPLFVRHGQKLVPTTVANKLIQPVREALQLFEKTLGDLDGFDPQNVKMNFSIGMRSLMENTYFLPLVGIVKAAAPNISLTSNHYDRQNLEAELSSGTLNAAIDVFLPLSPAVKRMHLTKSPSVVVARKNHPTVSNDLDLDTYLSLDHIIVTSRPNGYGPEDIALSRLGKSRNIVVRCQQISTAMRIINESDLVLTMAQSFARQSNAILDHLIQPSPFGAPEIDTYLYWHSNSDSDQANQWFRKMVTASALGQTSAAAVKTD
ncbi:MAG: LysR family transcriptional regulator [Robiginitomaculum sp.]|nr:MAG: LysR family transcriptional regulator [Robiginitomaculum sp.]